MKTLQLLKTVTPRCTRYFINSRRVTRDAFEEAKFWRDLSCLQTIHTGKTVRFYTVASSRN